MEWKEQNKLWTDQPLKTTHSIFGLTIKSNNCPVAVLFDTKIVRFHQRNLTSYSKPFVMFLLETLRNNSLSTDQNSPKCCQCQMVPSS